MSYNSSTRLLIYFVLTFSMVVVPGMLFGIGTARGDTAPTATGPGTQWSPAGPQYDKLQSQVYADEIGEFTAALTTPPGVDISDWPLPSSYLDATCATSPNNFQCDPRFFVTAKNAEFGMFDLDINHAATFFGVNFNFGNDGNPGIDIRQGIAHLFARPDACGTGELHINCLNIDNSLPPGQCALHSGNDNSAGCVPAPANPCTSGVGTSIGSYSYCSTPASQQANLVGACGSSAGPFPAAPAGFTTLTTGITTWDLLDTAHTTAGGVCTSAYHYGVDVSTNGINNVGSPDYCFAADHWIDAGLATGKDANCTLTGQVAALSGGHITFKVRTDSPPRKLYGQELAKRLCQLINGPAATAPCGQVGVDLITIGQAIGQVFTSGSSPSPNLGWNLYTAGWGLTSQFDQPYALYNGIFDSNFCGGRKATLPSNYIFWCNTAFDTFSKNIEFPPVSADISEATLNLQLADEVFGHGVGTIPFWSAALQLNYIKGFTNVNDQKGVSVPNFFTILNTWNPDPTTACGAAACGGSPGLIRWGFKQGTANLNPFQASTVWEFYVIGQVYDTLLAGNPYSPTHLFGWMANTFVLTAPQTGDPVGTAQDVDVILRNDMCWHDFTSAANCSGSGNQHDQVTASDIAASFDMFKATAGIVSPSLSGVLDTTIVNDFHLRINLNAKSPFTLFNIAAVPIVPQHLWATDKVNKCVSLVATPNACTIDPTLFPNADPVALHIFTGSGAWECTDGVVVGGNCTSSTSQTVDTGGTILLSRFGLGQAGVAQGAYFRSSAKWLQFRWADFTSLLSPGVADGKVDSSDLSVLLACLGGTRPATDPLCQHIDHAGLSSVTCTATAGTCNASSLAAKGTGVKFSGSIGGDANGLVQSVELSRLLRWNGVRWNFGVTYGTEVGALPLNQPLYEGGITYNP